ncbi:MAG: DUF547 domain-containing protein [Candidatus Binatia bacterium]
MRYGRGAAVASLALVFAASARAEEAFDHAEWTRLLERYVDGDGRVAYRDLAARDGAAFDAYLAALAAARPDAWPRAERLAFWINAYNAVIIKAVLDGYSAESLLGRYRIFFRYERTVAGAARTPDDIENRILRPSGEARLHFALVCASSSCPTLRRQAWSGATLDRDLDEEARRFVRDPRRNQIRPGAADIHLSMIFKWYRDDFGGNDEAVRELVGRYSDEPERIYLHAQRPDIEYRDYDWTMNAQPGQRP